MNTSIFISIDPDILSGTPVFKGTRIPVQTLFDYLKAGDSINEFIEGFPVARRVQLHYTLQMIAQTKKPHLQIDRAFYLIKEKNYKDFVTWVMVRSSESA